MPFTWLAERFGEAIGHARRRRRIHSFRTERAARRHRLRQSCRYRATLLHAAQFHQAGWTAPCWMSLNPSDASPEATMSSAAVYP